MTHTTIMTALRYPSVQLQRLTALALFLAFSAVATIRADALVPYRGAVWGVIQADASLTPQASSAMTFSPMTGLAPQVFSDLAITVVPQPTGALYLSCSGLGTTKTVGGDQLCCFFWLEGYLVNGEVEYVGSYQIMTGGTGRYAYSAKVSDLGSGLITGRAQILPGPDAATLYLVFEHEFEGDILQTAQRPAKRAK